LASSINQTSSNIGRHTFFDFGPPSDYYEVFWVRSDDNRREVERITVTPPGDRCTQPATVQIATASIDESVSSLLGPTSLCTIPEKDLRREARRCKGCLHFSGVDVEIQVQCGGQSRRIRMSVLDRDMFGNAPRTPRRTSWTMTLLSRLDRALGAGVMDQPLFDVPDVPAPPHPEESWPMLEDLRRGKFDALFEGTPDKPSELSRESRSTPPQPTVELSSSAPFRPSSYDPPNYPPIARLAHVEGQVAFTIEVTSDGSVTNMRILSGHVMLRKAVDSAVTSWVFPKEAAGQEIRATIDFKTNCPPIRR
jgi:TonB family protein